MWVFPLAAGGVALMFAAQLVRQFAVRRRPYQLFWALAMLMYGAASLAVVVGLARGWDPPGFEVFWVLGAVLNVPFLAAGEIDLLSRNRTVTAVLWLVLIFVSAYAVAATRSATIHAAALAEDLPSGRDVLGPGTLAHRLPQLISIPSYLILVGGATWSAWRMRGRDDLRDRFTGSLWIAIGATVIAGVGSAFAATGNAPLFSVSLLAGIAAMFWGFRRASTRPPDALRATAGPSSRPARRRGGPQQDPVYGHASTRDEQEGPSVASDERDGDQRQGHAAHREQNAEDLHPREG